MKNTLKFLFVIFATLVTYLLIAGGIATIWCLLCADFTKWPAITHYEIVILFSIIGAGVAFFISIWDMWPDDVNL